MNETILDAFERIPTKHKFNEEGFVAGVMYGDKIKEAISVKFDLVELIKILKKHGSNSKVWVKYGEEKKFGFVKEIQRHPVSAKINHIDIQIVALDQEVKLQLPITFEGESNLIDNLLELAVYKSEIDVFGTMDIMPDYVTINVADRKLGDSVTIKDFDLNEKIKVTDEEDEVYAAIVARKEIEDEEEVAEEAVTVEPVVEA
ncbi:50S ribosomal protein L25 [Clostridium sp.]|uniref:50S ribosomal protein L25 n=1 Tax=Clostridium sp. TaxID=1506 RepID=UPI003D6CB2F5